jgi:hypothetical protein
MKHKWFPPIISLMAFLLISTWIFSASSWTVVLARQSTATPLANSSGTGIFVTVFTDEPQINVRMGPSSSVYPIVGILLRGASAPALGRSQGGDWIKIEFDGAPNNSGWVYSPLVQISAGTLLIVEPPPTPLQPATATIDPTLAAQFVIVPTNTRPPTFTPPPSLTYPAFTQIAAVKSNDAVPMATIIIALALLGVVGLTLSLIIRR